VICDDLELNKGVDKDLDNEMKKVVDCLDNFMKFVGGKIEIVSKAAHDLGIKIDEKYDEFGIPQSLINNPDEWKSIREAVDRKIARDLAEDLNVKMLDYDHTHGDIDDNMKEAAIKAIKAALGKKNEGS
jgi:hypothetical protein